MNESDNPQMAKVWSNWGITSLEKFKSWLPDLKFNPAVNEDIEKQFEIIKKLLLHSYYEFDFLDVAFVYTSIVFELALRIRYKEIKQEDGSKKKLKQLIVWGSKEGLFETDEPVIQAMRQLRNILVHPRKDQKFGISVLDAIPRTVDVINGMYEDIELRKKRATIERKIDEDLIHFSKSGLILEQYGTQHIIFLARLLFHNNKVEPCLNYWLFWPIFDPKEHDGGIDVSNPIMVTSADFSTDKDGYRISDIRKNRDLLLRKIANPEQATVFENWRKEFNKRSMLQHVVNFNVAKLRNSIISEAFAYESL